MPSQLRRAYSIGRDAPERCWHCAGTGRCNCSSCGSYSIGLELVSGPCLVHAAMARQAVEREGIGTTSIQHGVIGKAGKGAGVSRAQANRKATAREVLRPDCQPGNTLFGVETSPSQLPID